MTIYVQYGCGLSCPDGWINFDASPTLRLQRIPWLGHIFRKGPTVFPPGVRYGDIVSGLPIADDSVDGIYASHVLEHLALEDFGTALNNTFRLLKPGGIFRLIVPDLRARAEIYIERAVTGDCKANSWFMETSGLGVHTRTRGVLALARHILGNSSHLWMWDEVSLHDALSTTGFVDVRRCDFNDCVAPAFQLVEAHGRFYDKAAGIQECAMEARKPF